MKNKEIKFHSIKFTHFAIKWCNDNSSYNFYELDEETQEEIYNKFLQEEIDETNRRL